ncbi:MAG: type III pantothenate kinase [Planctomycetota bacterium]
MNIIAIDIGNTTITVALFLNNTEKFIESVSGDTPAKLKKLLTSAWEQVPFVKGAKVQKKNGVIVVSSVKPAWTQLVADICKKELGEKIKVIGKDVSLPIETAVDDNMEVGTDRLVSAAAAFAVVEDAVVVADFGTAVTIDLVDEEGIFLGGCILPGFELSAKALAGNTAQLPQVKVTRPRDPIGANTRQAINCGLYYSAVGALEAAVRRYAEQIGKWPQLIVTGGAADVIKDDCEFVDSWVPNLAVKGVVLAYKKYLEDQTELAELTREEKNTK